MNYPGRGRARLPRLPAAHRLRRDEPGPAPEVALRLLPRPGARRRRQRRLHREFYDEYNAVLDMPAEYYLDTIKTVFQDFALVNGTWDVNGELVRPQDITTHRAADDRGRARRHLRRRPDRAAHELCTGVPEATAASTTTPRAPATTASSPAAAGARRSTPRCATSSPRTTQARGAARKPRREARRRRRKPSATPARTRADNRPSGEPPRPTSPTRLHDALPQTQCTRCGYPDCRGYAQAIAAGEADDQPVPARRRRRRRAAWRAITGRPAAAAEPGQRHRGAARAGA